MSPSVGSPRRPLQPGRPNARSVPRRPLGRPSRRDRRYTMFTSSEHRAARTIGEVTTPSLPVVDVAAFASGIDHDTPRGSGRRRRDRHGVPPPRLPARRRSRHRRRCQGAHARPAARLLRHAGGVQGGDRHRPFAVSPRLCRHRHRDPRRRQHARRRPQGDDRQRSRARTRPSRGRRRHAVARAQPTARPARLPRRLGGVLRPGGGGRPARPARRRHGPRPARRLPPRSSRRDALPLPDDPLPAAAPAAAGRGSARLRHAHRLRQRHAARRRRRRRLAGDAARRHVDRRARSPTTTWSSTSAT